MDRPPSKQSLWVLWLVIATCVAPVVASYGFYYWGKPSRSTNYGELLSAQPIPLFQEHQAPHSEVLQVVKGKWVLLSIDPVGTCAEACQWKHTVTRQLRLMQGKDQNRVARLWIRHAAETTEPADLPQPSEVTDGLSMLRLKTEELGWLGDASLWESSLYLIDPLGNLIMRFPVEREVKAVQQIHKDLAKLLRASRIG